MNGTKEQWKRFVSVTFAAVLLMLFHGCAHLEPLIQTPQQKGDAIAGVVAAKVENQVDQVKTEVAGVKADFKEAENNTKQKIDAAKADTAKALSATRDALSNDLKAEAENIRNVVSKTYAAGDPWNQRMLTGAISLALIITAWKLGNSTPSKTMEELMRRTFLENKT